MIELPTELPGCVSLTHEDFTVSRYASITGARDSHDDLNGARRRVLVELNEYEDCLTIAELRTCFEDIGALVPMLLGELEAHGLVEKHLPDDDSKAMHYCLTILGERSAEAN